MGTTTKTEPTVGRNRARESGPETELDEEREQQYDLLTAAIIGAAVGAGITLLLRRGPSGRRPVGPLVRYAGRGAALAGLAGVEGAKWPGAVDSKARDGPAIARWKARGGLVHMPSADSELPWTVVRSSSTGFPSTTWLNRCAIT